MTTTTDYGSWNNHGDKSEVSVDATVLQFVSGGDSEWVQRIEDDGSFDAMVSDYREAINKALPVGVHLTGDEFIGPAYEADQDFGGYPETEDGDLDLAAIVADIDLAAIVEKHDPDA